MIGGDPYVRSQAFGVNANYHLNPHWSVGGKFLYAFNSLRPEGESLINDREITTNSAIPDSLDYLKQEYLAQVNWYPFYGKLNLYDLGVAHFDFYGIGGAGAVQLKSGTTGTYTAGRRYWVLVCAASYLSYGATLSGL